MAGEEPIDPEEGGERRLRRKGVIAGLLLLAFGLALFTVSEVSGRSTIVSSLVKRVAALIEPEPDNSLRLVAVFSRDVTDSTFINGARMAVARVNADGGILGRELKLDLVPESGFTEKTALETTVSNTLKLSGDVARTKNLLGVIGHEWSDTAVTASSIYGRNDILYVATHATAAALTNHGFKTVFALQPDNASNAQMIANYAMRQGMRRFIVLSDKSDYGKECASFFSAAITSNGADLVYRGYLSSGTQSIDQLLMFILDNNLFKRSDFDAFFIVSSSIPETVEFIKRARYLGLDGPILGMEYMFSASIEKAVGKEDMKGVTGVSLYDRDALSERALKFVSEFRDTYEHVPDLDAALGYDAVMLVRDATRRAETLNPKKLSDTLKVARYKTPFAGVTGPIAFDRNGLITDTKVFIVRHDGEEFHTVGSYEIPANWDNLNESAQQKTGSDNAPPSEPGSTEQEKPVQ